MIFLFYKKKKRRMHLFWKD